VYHMRLTRVPNNPLMISWALKVHHVIAMKLLSIREILLSCLDQFSPLPSIPALQLLLLKATLVLYPLAERFHEIRCLLMFVY
jgi:hypothetical protein